MRSFLFTFLALVFLDGSRRDTSIPDTMVFCGIEISLTEGAKTKIRDIKKKLYENPIYFNAAVERGDTYLPFVEEALQDMGVPDDMKFVAMQESNLFPSAVSKSNAVGFWQFKADAARESGLRVDDWIDERKHIYRSSVAAASYLARANRDFDNWAYSIISYYEGLTGAVTYTDPANYGQKQMKIDENTHWYLIKTIAYKLTYEDALKLTIQPTTWLQPTPIRGPITVAELAQRLKTTEEKITDWNRWISNKEVPDAVAMTLYLPRNDLYITHTQDPNKLQVLANIKAHTPAKPQPVEQQPTTSPVSSAPIQPVPTPPIATTTPTQNPDSQNSVNPITTPTTENTDGSNPFTGGAISPTTMTQDKYVEIDLTEDFYYGMAAVKNGYSPEYVLYDGTSRLQDIGLEFRVSYADLLFWNGLSINTEPAIGEIVYLKKPSKSRFHIVKSGETMGEIARKHETSLQKIQKKNGMSPTDYTLYIGQKLYLKDSRPKNEKLVILIHKLLKTTQLTRPASPKQEIAVAPLLPAPAKEPTPTVTTSPPPIPVVNQVIVSTEEKSKNMETPPTNPVETGFVNIPIASRWLEHKAVEGETLWIISQKYKTKVEIIKRINNLSSDVVKPNQVLKIFTTFPMASPEGYVYHTVLGGEVIEKIAFRYGVNTEDITRENMLPTTNLQPGQVLKIKPRI